MIMIMLQLASDLTPSIFRAIRKPMATKVHINMSAALLLANLSFMIGIDEVN